MGRMRTDWVQAAIAAPVQNIGQLDAEDVRQLDAAVNRGELIKSRAPFFGRLPMKDTYASSAAVIDAMVAADRLAFDASVANDREQRNSVARPAGSERGCLH